MTKTVFIMSPDVAASVNQKMQKAGYGEDNVSVSVFDENDNEHKACSVVENEVLCSALRIALGAAEYKEYKGDFFTVLEANKLHIEEVE